MAKVSLYDELLTVDPDAEFYVYVPSGATAALRDRFQTAAIVAKIPSVVLDVAAQAEITVGAEDTNVRPITIQLKNADGTNVASVQLVKLGVFADAGAAALATTGGSTGIAAGAEGLLITHTAKLWFDAVSDATGLITLTWTDTGTEVAYLGVFLPDGTLDMSAALTNT